MNKDTVYTANQPLFFPHIYMMNRYANVGNFVAMNNAQFTKFGHQSRVELLDKHGNERLVIIPLKNRSFKAINEVELDNPIKAITKFMKTLKTLYGSAPHFVDVFSFVEETMATAPVHEGVTLAEFNNRILHSLFMWLELPVKWYDSDVIVPVRSDAPSEWVAQMGAAINCTLYVGGGTAQNAYIKEEDFSSRGMSFVAQDFKLEGYTRFKGAVATRATVSILDPLFWVGKDATLDIITKEAY